MYNVPMNRTDSRTATIPSSEMATLTIRNAYGETVFVYKGLRSILEAHALNLRSKWDSCQPAAFDMGFQDWTATVE